MRLPADLGFESHPHDARRMVRRDARDTEIAAAVVVQRTVTAKMQTVLGVIAELGGAATGEQVETHRRTRDWAASTARKRITDLVEAGLVVADGTRLNSRGLPMTLWRRKDTTPEKAASVAAPAAPVSAAAPEPSPAPLSRGYEVGERVRVRATGRLVEVYDVANLHEPAFAQRVLCGWTIVKGGQTLAGVDEWFDGDELERVGP